MCLCLVLLLRLLVCALQVAQTEQASIQSAFRLVGSLAGMYAPLFFTNHCFDVKWTSWRVITYAFVGYGLHAVATVLFFCAYMMDRYIIYHSSNRVVADPRLELLEAASGSVNVGGLDYRRIDDYRREQNSNSGSNFDYRREFYARADRNYRVAGIFGNGGGSKGSNSNNGDQQRTTSRNARDLGAVAAARPRDAAQNRQQEQRARLSNSQGMRGGRRQQRQRQQPAQQQPLLSPVRSTHNSDL